MAQTLTEMRSQILDKDKAAVRELLGEPVKVGYWKKPMRPEGATPADLAAFEAQILDQIWIYYGGRVHFNLAGMAVKVDDKTGLDLPPPEHFV